MTQLKLTYTRKVYSKADVVIVELSVKNHDANTEPENVVGSKGKPTNGRRPLRRDGLCVVWLEPNNDRSVRGVVREKLKLFPCISAPAGNCQVYCLFSR